MSHDDVQFRVVETASSAISSLVDDGPRCMIIVVVVVAVIVVVVTAVVFARDVSIPRVALRI